MLYVVVGWTDGFGNDTYVKGIYSTREKAIKHCDLINPPDRIAEVNFGEVDLDYNDLPDIEQNVRRKKKRG